MAMEPALVTTSSHWWYIGSEAEWGPPQRMHLWTPLAHDLPADAKEHSSGRLKAKQARAPSIVALVGILALLKALVTI